jgi:hypothetical protein
MAKIYPTDHIPLEAKAIAIGRWHQEALLRRGAVIREFRDLKEIPRALEGFWIVMEASLAHFEGRVMTQKDIAARATGTASPATISRAIQDVEDEGWIVTKPSRSDARVRTIEITAKTKEYYLSKVESSWQAFWSIAENALAAAQRPDPER